MKQIAILGLGHFGKSVLDELLELKVEVLIVDKSRELIDAYKDSPAEAVMLDVLSVETLRKVLPDSTDAVIIDMGDKVEASILAASYCSKLAIKTIIVCAESESQAEILGLVGATKVVFPNREAAKRITPLLLSSTLLNYLPVGGKLAIAELAIPKDLIGARADEELFKGKYHLNLIALRGQEEEDLHDFGADYVFQEGDVGLFAGADESLNQLTGYNLKERQKSALGRLLNVFLRRK
jgi:trk system potassium uptake protein TrkA